jgi:hypothetical protein
MNRVIPLCFLVLTLAASAAFSAGSGTKTAPYALEEIASMEGFAIPECVVKSMAGDLYVSNVVTDNEGYWVDDGTGFISKISKDGTLTLRWLDSTTEAPLHGPKGMTLLKDKLYFSDNKSLRSVTILPSGKAGSVETIPLPESGHLNDLATDGQNIYVTDTELSLIYRVTPSGEHSLLPAPENINGITCHKGKIFAVSWGLHDVYQIDPKGKKAPKPFGLADHFTNLDAIEVLDDGSYIVSDFKGNKVSLISANRKKVWTLAELDSPADIGFDREKGLIYVPQLMEDRMVTFQLKKAK